MSVYDSINGHCFNRMFFKVQEVWLVMSDCRLEDMPYFCQGGGSGC